MVTIEEATRHIQNSTWSGRGRGIRANLVNSGFVLIAEIERLREALTAIVKHQEEIGGGLAVLSVTRRIAADALRPEGDEFVTP